MLEAVGRVREKYPAASKLYDIEVIPEKEKPATDKNLRAVDIIWERKEEKYEKLYSSDGPGRFG